VRYLEPIERRVEDVLARRRREDEARRDRQARLDEATQRAQAYAPGPYRRAIGGEIAEDIIDGFSKLVARRGRSQR
jgi:hypothetical protein